MKKTALKWFEEQLYEFETISESLPNKLYELLSIAKDMEKDIITEAYSQGRIDEETRFPYATDGEDYYKTEFCS
jgi:hypothetical protein